MHYDLLIVGSGAFGSVCAHEATARGLKCLVIDKRPHTGGNAYCEKRDGIRIHRYGAHIFHTSFREVWDYVCRFAEFNDFINAPVANFEGELYNLPFNMNTFCRLWDDVRTPRDAIAKIESQRLHLDGREPEDLEEQALSLVGRDIYEKLIKGYTEKQWGRPCSELPAFIIKRVPLRFTFDNRYFSDRWQGIPIGGYNRIFDALLEGSDVELGTDFTAHRGRLAGIADRIIYTGPIDEYYGYRLGQLEYRGLRFETDRYEEADRQGVAVINYTSIDVPYTRTIEHKHFELSESPVTYITREYPSDWHPGDEAYYPVNDERNQALYQRYRELADREDRVIFGGRLGEYRYYDMDDAIKRALETMAGIL